jgi:hypothetical protein
MKKVLLLLGVAALALVALLAVGDRGARAQPSPDLIQHYKCYQARHAKRSPRFQTATVFLSDQFEHNKQTRVISLGLYCSNGSQSVNDGVSVGGGGGETDDLTCYTIRDAPRQTPFRAQNISVRDKLTNWGDQVLTVSKAESLCVPASKNSTLRRFGEGFKCYIARTAKRQPRFQQVGVSISDQFGEKDARVIRPVAYCSFVEKKLEALNDDILEAPEIHKGLLKGGGSFEDHISTTLATVGLNDPIISCKVDYTHSVWYRWTYSGNKSLILTTEGSTYDTVLAVFEDNDPTDGIDLKEVACNNNTEKPCRLLLRGVTAGEPCCEAVQGTAGHGCASPQPNPWSTLQFNAFANHDYYILVGSSEGRGGKLKLFIDDKVEAQDNCQVGANIPFLDTLYYEYDTLDVHRSTLNATETFFEAGCNYDPLLSACLTPGDDYSNSVWFRYASPDEFQKIEFDASESDYDTIVAVTSQGGGNVQACGFGSTQLTLSPNTTYYILVGDVSEDRLGGKLKMTVTHRGALPANPAGRSSAAGVGQQGVPDSITCYEVRQARHRAETEEVRDQFSEQQLDEGGWLLSIGTVKRFCVPSNKTTCTNFGSPTGAVEPAQLCEG